MPIHADKQIWTFEPRRFVANHFDDDNVYLG